MQEFERSRVDLGGGQCVTITSWYDAEKSYWRGSAPALLHMLASPDGSDSAVLSGATRDKAILAVRGILTRRLGVKA
jgi:hypothetical protein